MIAKRLSAAFLAFSLVFGAFIVSPAQAFAETPVVSIDLSTLEDPTASLDDEGGEGSFYNGVFNITAGNSGNVLDAADGTVEGIMDWASNSGTYRTADEDYMLRLVAEEAVADVDERHVGSSPIWKVKFKRQDGTMAVYLVNEDGTIQ